MDTIIADAYRQHSRRVLSTLVRLLGSFELAEDAMHDAYLAAAAQWPAQGVPTNVVAWLVSAARFKAIDRMRRDRCVVAADDDGSRIDSRADEGPGWEQRWDEREAIEDDLLRLIFTCCHPSLSESAQLALTLREVCGLRTEAIAAAFLIPPTTLAQRIVRAKSKIAAARIPYEVPGPVERPARLASVLRVIYLMFNEGESARAAHLIDESIRLARLLRQLLQQATPINSSHFEGETPEVSGLLALLLLHDARRSARTTVAGELVPLESQDRSRWDRGAVDEGCALALQALSRPGFGRYSLQAAIAAVHAEAGDAAATDWAQIVGLYDALLQVEPSPVIALNRAVAVAMRDGPEAGLALIEPLRVVLAGYPPLAAASADLCRRAGRLGEARSHYRDAAALARQEPERRYLMGRLAELDG